MLTIVNAFSRQCNREVNLMKSEKVMLTIIVNGFIRQNNIQVNLMKSEKVLVTIVNAFFDRIT